MNDYIPTTENIRDAYATENQGYQWDWNDCISQFDRWIAQHDAEVAKATENRIIKLLEKAKDCRCSPEYGVDYDNYCYCDAIALLEGEK